MVVFVGKGEASGAGFRNLDNLVLPGALYLSLTPRARSCATMQVTLLDDGLTAISVEDIARRSWEQFEVFQSVVNPDKLALLKRWTDQATLDSHARLRRKLPPFKPEHRTATPSGKTTRTIGPGNRDFAESNREESRVVEV